MIKFSQSLQHYPSDDFKLVLKNEIEACDKKLLPLEKGTVQGGYVSDEPITATVLRVTDQTDSVQVLVGIFFTEIVICCGCGDDPMPANTYCEMRLDIDKQTAETKIKIIPQ
ncbi:MAG: glucosamine--fructose-6-phosphate aminotransferase [Gammaproteobacteria bacterium]|nr:glucosamine--fructose-6-phosphate aminotransferase [Gammaproteobacteria bacterium]